MNSTLYILTSDKTCEILPVMMYLVDKYWDYDVKILGFSKYDDSRFVSIANKQESIQKWTRYLYDYFSKIDDEYVTIILDDFFLLDYPDQSAFESAFSYLNKEEVKRVELGITSSICHYKKYDKDFLAYTQASDYRITCQPSIWKREYLLEFLNNDWTPWEFEVKGSDQARNDGNEMLLSQTGMLKTSQLSGMSKHNPGLINILGIKPIDVQELIKSNLLDPERLIYGFNRTKPFRYLSYDGNPFDILDQYIGREAENLKRYYGSSYTNAQP